MRLVTVPTAFLAALLTTSAHAQTTDPQKRPAGTQPAGPTAERPIDKGPYTHAADGAYQGGGVVLQGAPGAPAPRPKATPPGQVPQNALPPK